jgi:hypothetical protein
MQKLYKEASFGKYNFGGGGAAASAAAAQKLSRLTLVEMNALHCMLRCCIRGQGILEAVENLVRGVL